jgi:CBS domain-containing protein
MRISDILRSKTQDGADKVYSIAPDRTLRDLVGILVEHEIGALVVGNGADVVGIVSERDVVRKLHEMGAAALELPVSDLMTSPAQTCSPTDSVDEIAATMTARRFRHMPVVSDGVLIGVVSIGDVVKNRIRELETDRNTLEQYVTG